MRMPFTMALSQACLCLLLAANCASAFTFSVPYKQNEWALLGNAKISDNGIKLAGGPDEAGSVWTKEIIPYDEWTLEAVVQTVSDQTKFSGDSGFTLWYTAKPNADGKVHGGGDMWDGLAVMMDGLDPNNMGEVRGHLNDGSYKFLESENVETDALSLCRVPYRKATGPITLRIGYSQNGFAVDVNGQRCFRSKDVVLPPGHFGISANSAKSGDTLLLKQCSVRANMDVDLVRQLDAADTHDSESGAGDGSVSGPSVGVVGAPPPPVANPELNSEQENIVAPNVGSSSSYPDLSKLGPELSAQVREVIDPTYNKLAYVEKRLAAMDQQVSSYFDNLMISVKELIANQKPADSTQQQQQQQQHEAMRDEIRSLRNLLEEIHKTAATSAEHASNAASKELPTQNAPGLGKIALVVALVQIIIMLGTRLAKRKNRQKLL